MRVAAMLLANSAGVDNGLLNVHGAGWEQINATGFPCNVSGFVTGVVDMDDSELGVEHVLRLVVVDGDTVLAESSSYIRARAGGAPPPGVPAREPFAFAFTAAVREPALLAARLVTESGDELASLTFAVVPAPQPVG